MAARRPAAPTVEEKVLLHLSQFLVSGDDYEAPIEVTQEGIAEAIGISPTHVPRAVNALRKKEFLVEQKMHVPGGDRRRKAYRLTHEGYQRAFAVRDRVLDGIVLVRGPDGAIRETTLAELLGPKTPVAQVIDALARAEGLSLIPSSKRRTPRREPHAAIFSRVPTISTFVGRKEELKVLHRALEDKDVRLVVVSGVAGIGKTTLVAKALERFKPRDHIFWYRLHEWETLRNLGFTMGDFLAAIGHPTLKRYMEENEEHDPVQVYKTLTEEFSDVEAVVVLDDFDKAPENVAEFVQTLLPHLENFPRVTFVAIARTVSPILSETDLVEGRAVEVVLQGLDERSAKSLVKDVKLDPRALEGLVRLTGGHPLLLRLAEGAAAGGELPGLEGAAGKEEPAAGREGAERDVLFSDRIGRYLSKEVLAALSEKERTALEAASVHRYPFPAEALFRQGEIEFDVVDALRGRILLRQVGGRYVEVADFIREFVYARLAAAKRQEYHLRAAESLAAWGETVALWEVPYHLARGGQVREAASLALSNAQELLKAGKNEEILNLLKEFPQGAVDEDTWREMAALRVALYRRWGDAERVSQWEAEASRPQGAPRRAAL